MSHHLIDMGKAADFPALFNFCLDSDPDRFIVISAEGQTCSDQAEEAYRDLMSRFNLAFAFYPYSEILPKANRLFRTVPLPAVNITMLDGTRIDAVRNPNPGWMIFDKTLLEGMRFNGSYQEAFLEAFLEALAAVGAIPVRGLFLDVPESHKLFNLYRGAPIKHTQKHAEELKNLEPAQSSDAAALFEFVYQKSKLELNLGE